jgi:hypothetical protein
VEGLGGMDTVLKVISDVFQQVNPGLVFADVQSK